MAYRMRRSQAPDAVLELFECSHRDWRHDLIGDFLDPNAEVELVSRVWPYFELGRMFSAGLIPSGSIIV
jgi:hypothetical protein